MGPYSHLVIARSLSDSIKPFDLADYLWGSVAPDLRYMVPGMQRRNTHLPISNLLAFKNQYPQLESFIQGYLVHCLSDHLNFPHLLQKKFPFSHLKSRLTARTCTVLLEFYNIQKDFPPVPPFTGRINPMLSDLGITAIHVRAYDEFLQSYLKTPSIETALSMSGSPRHLSDPRIENYRNEAQNFQRNWLLKKLLLWGLDRHRINAEIVQIVRALLPDGFYSSG